MKFFTTLSLLASMALASPLMERAKLELQARNAARRTDRFRAFEDGNFGNITAQTVQSSNWGGAAIVTSGVTAVSGTFTVPKPSPPSGGSSSREYCGAAWVGIDGYSNSALIQTGVLWCVQGSSYEYEAWYEYLPAALIEYSGFSVTAGNSVTVTVTKTSATGGTTTISSGGRSASHTFSGQSTRLQGASAEWIVEDFLSGNSLVPFANFGTVTFTGATAVINGATVSASSDSPVTIDLVSSSGSVLTNTGISGTSVTVSYV
ncbi:peptidase A4 family-domain-containing protein [Xylaria bambusicola]|uniref:peptidase A4 family-domain-containing protein n=1 Tax=Xylaria bambusicola TaxID=326684 RepID=UPI002007B39E|nr:peptidase A4 family-domain-containing protein [Xylaria bambusicola]KAI0518296.1 peptidase A4 family-domain-containing protein [Xylaria bambusicola]